MAKIMKKQREVIWLILFLVLFFKNVIEFFSEGVYESPVTLTLFNYNFSTDFSLFIYR